MPTPDPKSFEFFEQTWRVYRKIVDENWMSHREIFDEVTRTLNETISSEARLLDLGCGDGGTMAPILKQIHYGHYLGVDASEPALSLARQTLAEQGDKTHLCCSDMLDFLRHWSGEKFDLILVSFSLHHLDPEQKREFLGLCKTVLSDQGLIIIVDVFRAEGQSRETYLNDYCEDMANRWTTLTAQELEMVTHHVRNFDFPEPLEDFIRIADSVQLHPGRNASWHGYHAHLTLKH